MNHRPWPSPETPGRADVPRSAARWLMAMSIFVAFSSCATSPLYKADPSSGYGTVPRNEMGEPIWEEVGTVPAEEP